MLITNYLPNGKEHNMPGKKKYCSDCKGFGNLYHENIIRYGDKRTKEKKPIMAMPCTVCVGTGLQTTKTEKSPDFNVVVTQHVDELYSDDAQDEYKAQQEELAAEKAAEENAEENSVYEKPAEDSDPIHLTDIHVEPKEGEMPL